MDDLTVPEQTFELQTSTKRYMLWPLGMWVCSKCQLADTHSLYGVRTRLSLHDDQAVAPPMPGNIAGLSA